MRCFSKGIFDKKEKAQFFTPQWLEMGKIACKIQMFEHFFFDNIAICQIFYSSRIDVGRRDFVLLEVSKLNSNMPYRANIQLS